ncbi:MAG: hypothetical protein ABI446_01710 [Gemmatimonadaceae bacterium]
MSFELAGITSHVLSSPRVQNLSTSQISRIPSSTNTELLLVVAAKTAIPRTSLFLSVQWLPTANITRNPYTEYTAGELGDQSIKGNSPSFTLGLSATAIKPDQLGGLASLSVYAGDLFSSAARPDDGSAYTHKLDTGLNLTLLPFGRVSRPSSWLHGVNVFALLDDVLTGLPRAGDEVPRGSRTFLDNARAVSLIYGISLPISH